MAGEKLSERPLRSNQGTKDWDERHCRETRIRMGTRKRRPHTLTLTHTHSHWMKSHDDFGHNLIFRFLVFPLSLTLTYSEKDMEGKQTCQSWKSNLVNESSLIDWNWTRRFFFTLAFAECGIEYIGNCLTKSFNLTNFKLNIWQTKNFFYSKQKLQLLRNSFTTQLSWKTCQEQDM